MGTLEIYPGAENLQWKLFNAILPKIDIGSFADQLQVKNHLTVTDITLVGKNQSRERLLRALPLFRKHAKANILRNHYTR
jgi:hypothetical protein